MQTEMELAHGCVCDSYLPIISSGLIMADNISPFFPASNSSCVAWTAAYETWTTVLLICFEVLLIVRVLALYNNHRLLRYGLITLSVSANLTRIIFLSISIPGYTLGDDSNDSNDVVCHGTVLPSIAPAVIFIAEIIPETVFFVLAVIKLIHTKKTTNIAVSQLLVVIVCDGSWAFALFFAFYVWNILQSEITKQKNSNVFFWVAPVIGFIGSRLTLNLRSKAKAPPGGTNVEISEIKFTTIDAAEPMQETA